MRIRTNSNYKALTLRKNHLVNETLKFLELYLTEKQYPKEILQQVTDSKFISENPDFYCCYPYLFEKYFEIDNPKNLQIVAAAGFLYYRSLLFIDDIFDSGISKGKFNLYFISNICQEECIKLLCSIFSLHSKFWGKWDMRKIEYAKAYILERDLNSNKSYDYFEVIADYKSAFGKIAIDALYNLFPLKKNVLYEDLLNSHKQFYIAFQILDDIKDFREDKINGQFNISDLKLQEQFKKGDNQIDNYSIEERNKLIYLDGVAQDLYLTAISHASEALGFCSDKEQDCLWIIEIERLYNTAINHWLNIDGFLNKALTARNAEVKLKLNNINAAAIKSATDFIISKQKSDGSWEDMLTDAGLSNVWVSSYVLYTLRKINILSSKEFYIAGISFVNKAQSDCSWGYNTKWISDLDSTSFALLSLKNHLNESCYIERWSLRQNNDGGFATYNDENQLLASLGLSDLPDVKGWTQSHLCVSAVCLLVFVEYNRTDAPYKNTRDFIRKQLLSEDEFYFGYWWSESIYTLYYILLSAVNSDDKELIDLVESKMPLLIDKPYNNFFKGLLISTLCLTDRLFNSFNKQLKRLVNELINDQFVDGSWQQGNSLRIPHPSALNVDLKDIVWRKADKGTNILVEDHNRIFTTISCLNAVYSYQQKIGKEDT